MRLDIHNSRIPLLCRSCEARHQGICGVLDPDQLIQLSRHTSRREFPAGAEIVPAGEPVTHFGNILRGVVKLTKALPDGRQQVVGLQFAPDFVGRPFAETSEVRAEAAGVVRICLFPRPALEAMIEASPSLGRRLYDQALRELDEARDWMLTLGRKTATERVISFLLLVSRHTDPESGPATQFELPLGRADVADLLGLTIETVSRQITQLRKAGLIAVEGSRHVTLCDVPALEAAAGH